MMISNVKDTDPIFFIVFQIYAYDLDVKVNELQFFALEGTSRDI